MSLERRGGSGGLIEERGWEAKASASHGEEERRRGGECFGGVFIMYHSYMRPLFVLVEIRRLRVQGHTIHF